MGRFFVHLFLLPMKFTDHKNQEALVNTCEELTIPTKAAIPLRLIVNEIATNAMKYGFTSDEEAQFTVELTNNEETAHYILTLSNTGNPFPEGISL